MNSILEWLFGRGDFMETFSGAKYYPASPRPDDVRIVDIAHHLSMLCRYTGACRDFYSVAEHSVNVSYCVPPELQFEALMHDATEAYTNDQGRPLKRHWMMWGYRVIEQRNWLAIAEHFHLPRVLSAETHYADNAVLLTERAALMYPTGRPWNINVEPAEVPIHCWSPKVAEGKFMDRFYELTRGLPQRQRLHWRKTDEFMLNNCEGALA